MSDKVESTLAKYLEFKVFELFRAQLISTISPHCREDSKDDVYKHLFLAPADLSKERNFQLHGVLSPFVCLWRTTPLVWDTDNGLYARSVLPRDFIYQATDGSRRYERGYLYDIQFNVDLFSSSYYKDFRDRVNQDLIDFDRLRYKTLQIPQLLSDCSELTTSAEIRLTGINATDNVTSEGNRSFDLTASYTVKVTIPYAHGFLNLQGVQVYINDSLIYENILKE